MITLKEALKLIKPSECEHIYLQQVGTMKSGLSWYPYIYTEKEIRNRYDMKAVKVHEIRPNFYYGEFAGMKLFCTGPGFNNE